MIHIYSLIAKLIIFTFSLSIFAQEDIGTYCFEKGTSASQVFEQIIFLKTGTDKIQIRREENCIDVFSNQVRLGIYEKMIWKISKPISNEQITPDGYLDDNCKIELTSTAAIKEKKVELQIGNKSQITQNEKNEDQVTKTDILISKGKTGSIVVDNKRLELECLPKAKNKYLLTFYLNKKNAESIHSSIEVSTGQKINIGQIKNELETKSKTTGITEIGKSENSKNENIKYEIEVL